MLWNPASTMQEVSGSFTRRTHVRILLVDRCPIFREGLKTLVTRTIREATFVDEAENYRVLRGKVEEADLLIVEGDPDVLGLLAELDKAHRRRYPPFVLILATQTDNHHAVQFLSAGADGYLRRPAPLERMLEAIRKVSSGRRYVSDEIADEVLLNVDLSKKCPSLSQREYQVLALMASGLTVSEIGDKLALSPKTISTYRVRLLEKLQLRNNAELIRYAYQEGMIR